jgi:ankyrin repeat protein
MSNLMVAVGNGDLESVKRLVAEGADVKEKRFQGYTPFLLAATKGRIPIMHWLLTEGGSSLAERTLHGAHALSLAALNQRWPAMQYLLEEKGAKMTEDDNGGTTAWALLSYSVHRETNVAELSSLLKVMVMLEDVPLSFIADLSTQYADICTRGRHFRAQLPSYLEQQRAAVVTHCPLPAVLRSLVAEYAATTPEDMWADGLRVQAPRAKRGRTENDKEDEEDGEDAPPLRRSLRQRQKHA